ncbi:MAG: hypothetical protein PVI86_11585 [Phycisphaerae bacterium]|jgi:hypothetical protein
MTRQRHPIDLGRPIKRTLYVITGLHVAVGFLIAVPAAFSGDRLSAFLGWLIIVVALTAAAVVDKVLRLSAGIRSAGQTLDRLLGRVERVEKLLHEAQNTQTATSEPTLLDLASIGRGDPTKLVAASLHRDEYPRLVTTMETDPPAESTSTPMSSRVQKIKLATTTTGRKNHTAAPHTPGDIKAKNLRKRWNASLRDEDLASCRNIFAAFIDTAEPATVASMHRELARLADRIEASLRRRFTRHAHEHDFAGLLMVGEQISALLPDRPIADEFRRLKPHLLERWRQSVQPPPTARLRVIP